jgi:predicted dehydrogenase
LTKDRIRVALIGCGGVTARYRAVYGRSPLCRPVAFIDRDIEIARAAARDCGADERAATTHLMRALEDDVDAVVVNTPNHFHREHGLAVIESGKHLLMQKPLAATLDDAEVLAAAVEGSDRINGIYHSFLDHPLYHHLRERVADGDLGPVLTAHARYMHRGGIAWSKAAQLGHVTWRSSLQQTGGGCFIQLGVHYMHLISWITGEDATHVRGYAQNLHSPGIEGEDVATAMFRYPSGMVATIETSWITQGSELSISNAANSTTYLNDRWLFAGDASPASMVTPPAMDDETNAHNGHRAFLEAIAGLRPIPVPLERGLTEMRAIDAFYRSARNGTELAIEAPGARTSEAVSRVLTGDR